MINNEFADLISYFYSEYEGLGLSREVDSASYESVWNLGNEARPKRIIRINVSHSVAAMKLGRGAIK